jgi:hypothetical protein
LTVYGVYAGSRTNAGGYSCIRFIAPKALRF